MSDNPGLTTIFVDEKATKRRLKRAKLLVVDGPDRGKELVIERERVTLGRSLICDLVLADKAVSGTHAEVIATERGFVLKDLESTNGTKVGDIRVREVWIKPGQTFVVGQTRVQFEPQQGEVEIELGQDFAINPAIKGALKSLDGVDMVEEL